MPQNKFVAPILSCKICSWYKRKKGCFGFCRRLNEDLTMNYAPICKAYDYGQGVRILGTLLSPPANKEIREFDATYDVDDDYETLIAKDGKGNTLYTVSFTYDASKNWTKIKRVDA